MSKDAFFNLKGQRLGRKGKDTRDRIIAAAQKILSTSPTPQITLSAVMREASLKVTSVYVYFKDLTELLLATLVPVMETAEEAYMSQARERWPDDKLYACCLDFVSAYLAFWKRHSAILHLRNSMADQHDRPMLLQRRESALPMIALLAQQMDADSADSGSAAHSMASVLLTGLERVVTIATDTTLPSVLDDEVMPAPLLQGRLEAEAKLMELGIREIRKLR